MLQNNKGYKVIRISQKNYDILNKLGKTNDTYISVLDRIFADNNLLGIVTTEEQED
jgi:hypothetical protein